MRYRNARLAAALVALTLLPIGSVVAWALVLRSDWYAGQAARVLSDYLDLPAEIGRVVPLARRARAYREVLVWLPERRGEALRCAEAIVRETPTPEAPNAYELILTGGFCEVSARTWLGTDYRNILESGLRPAFSPDGPRKVTFSDMRLEIVHRGVALTLHDTSGNVSFPRVDQGVAIAICRRLGDYAAPEPVHLQATFAPTRTGVRVEQLTLTVPELPLSAAGLAAFADLPLEHTRFAGTLRYAEHPSGVAGADQPFVQTLVLSGEAFGLDLAELTAGTALLNLSGRCPEMQVQELRLRDGRIERLRFRGTLQEVSVAPVLQAAGLAPVPATATLHVGAADVSPAGVHFLVATGEARDIDLAALVAPLDAGTMNGALQVRIDELRVDANRLTRLRGEIWITTRAGEPIEIDMSLAEVLAERLVNVQLPPLVALLGEKMRLSRFGLRFDVADEQLLLFGTHGAEDAAIASMRLMGSETPVIRAPQRVFDLTPLLDPLRVRFDLPTEPADDPAQPLGPGEGVQSVPERGAGAFTPTDGGTAWDEHAR